jgi:hypothetical protein
MGYMKACEETKEPFFAYLPYNVAHWPQDMPPNARPEVSARTAIIENMQLRHEGNTKFQTQFAVELGSQLARFFQLISNSPILHS